MISLEKQLTEYGQLQEEMFGPISVDEVNSPIGPTLTMDVRNQPPQTRLGRGIGWAVAAFAVVLTVGGLYFAFSGGDGQVVDDTIPTATTLPTATTALTPTTAEGGAVGGWPGTMGARAGVFSWDGDRCAGSHCTIGVMHNGSRDIKLSFNAAGPQGPDDSATAVTVAGYDGIYRRIDEFDMEKWIVDIDGRMIDISLTAEPGTSQADLDEAHAIVDSIRVEPSDNNLGFRLVFTLTTDGWNSG